MRLPSSLAALTLAVAFSCRATEPPHPAPEAEPGAMDGARTTDTDPAPAPPAVAMPAAMTVALQDPGEPAPQDFEGARERRELLQERQAFLAERYIEQGDAELERGDLEAALQSFSSALEVDPTSEEARTRLRRVRALMGEEYAGASEQLADETARAEVQRAQARLAVEDLVTEGDNALRQGRYGAALESYRQAETVLRWNPLIATESLDARILAAKVEQARTLQGEAARLEAERLRVEAETARAEAEQAEMRRREERLAEYYLLANQAFVNDRFAEAERWTRLILMDDPGNEAASELMRTAREARHHRADELNRKHYREQWLRTFEELDTMNVPQTEPLKFTLERWRTVRERTPLTHGRVDSGDTQERQAVVDRLDEFRFAPNFGGPAGDGTPLAEVAGYLQSLTGVNFWISPEVRDELDEEETSIVLQLPERSVRQVLDIIADTSESLRWTVEDGVVKFVTREQLTGGQVLITYSVQDLTHPIPDYPGREINITPSGGLIPLDEDLEERESNVVTLILLEDLIRNNIAPESWDEDPANSIRTTESGQLVVNQVPDVQEKIQRLLQDLREATGIMVDIQARFMKVEDNFLEDIGVDFRGLGQPGLGVNGFDFNDFGDASTQNDLGREIGQGSDLGAFYDEGDDGDVRARVEDLYDEALGNEQVLQGSGGLSFQWTFLNDMQLELILRAVSKSERVELVTAPRILVHNTARANLSVLNQVAYVQDFDVEIAQAASIADPIISVIQDGVILDVRPVVSADRRFINMELRPTIAQLRRPIAESITTLGSQNAVTIQLPEVEIQRVRTSIPIPDGGTVLLGGNKISERQDKRSGVPILNKIPLLNALFERKGNFISNRKLLILLRASIVIPPELEPSAAELGLAE